MRLVLALAALLLLTAARGAATATSSVPRCARNLPHLRSGLADAVVITTDCARFRLQPDGRVTFAGSYALPVPPEADGWSPLDLSWSGVERDHLVIGVAMRRLWRSHDTYPGRAEVEPVLGRRALAFEYVKGTKPSALYFAQYSESERVIAHGETPLMFVRGKLVTQSEHGGALILRGSDGRRERVLAAHPGEVQVDRASKMVLFRSKGWLFVFDGICSRKLVSLRRLGFGGLLPTIEPLGRLLAVHDQRRLVVLDYNGRRVASTPLPPAPKRADGISSAVVPSPAGTAVAFTATNSNTAAGSPGRETVYVLRAGERRARQVLSENVMFKVCERMADLAWHGALILYSNSEQNAAIVDSSGRTPPLQLTRLVARLPGLQPDGRFDVAWA